MHNLVWRIVILLWSVSLVATVKAKPEERPRNLLLITLDTVRADHLSCNGSDKVQTPRLDRLARDGVNFTRARAPVPLTLPSHASILTGRYPPAHGVHDNGAFRLPQGELTLAEVLKGHGYETAAFTGSFVLDHRFGLAQGFDVYDDRMWSDPSMLENMEAERKAEAVYEAFAEWLKENGDRRPFFAWVHLYDPHAPYVPPEPFLSRYRKDPYAGEIAYTDAVVGKIVDELESRNLLTETLVAVVGDHGEGLGDHDERTHSLLIYNSTLHVPMLLFAPGLLPEGRKIDDLTRTIDLAPTLLDYMGWSERPGQGTSLRPLIEGRRLKEEIVAYSESAYPELNLGWSELRGLETDRYRFILAPRKELYDLGEDRGETENLVSRRPRIAGELGDRLEALIEKLDSSGEPAGREMDPETEAKLRSLGYVSSRGSPVARDAPPVDPKDKMDAWNRIQFAIFQFGHRDYGGALVTLNEVLASEKDIPMVYEYLGSCHMRLEQWSEVESVTRQALERGIESADFHINLGLIHFRRKEFAQAETELKVALALHEHSVPAHFRLADVYRAARIAQQKAPSSSSSAATTISLQTLDPDS